MNRILIGLLIFFATIFTFPISIYAVDEDYNNYIENYDFSFFDDLSNDVKSVLDDLGVSDFDYDKITSLSFNDIVDTVKKMLVGKAETPIQACVSVLIFIILSAFFQSFKVSNSTSLSSVYSTITALIISTVLIVKISSTISYCATTLSVASNFIYAFIPTFSAIVVAGGGVTTSFSTNSMLLVMAQGLSFVSTNVFLPISNCFLAIGICSGLRAELNLANVITTLKRVITSLISFISAGFVSILSIKTAVSAKADILGIRSLRFLINSVVPIIGGTISEGLLSIQSYSALIRSSVGVVGIIAVALVFLPSIFEIVIWRFCLSLCGIIADIFCDKSVNLILNAFRDTLLILNVILILSMMTTIISIGILIAAKTA